MSLYRDINDYLQSTQTIKTTRMYLSKHQSVNSFSNVWLDYILDTRVQTKLCEIIIYAETDLRRIIEGTQSGRAILPYAYTQIKRNWSTSNENDVQLTTLILGSSKSFPYALPWFGEAVAENWRNLNFTFN